MNGPVLPRSPMRRLLPLLLSAALGVPVAAQPAAPPSRTFTADEVAGLLDGRGLGFARPAETQGYPGPMHVRDLADSLGLSPDQRAGVEQTFAAMRAEARRLGAEVVAEGAALDRLFAERRATPEAIAAGSARLGALQGRLRAVHLRAHVETRALLTDGQAARYAVLRGYTAAGASPGHRGHH